MEDFKVGIFIDGALVATATGVEVTSTKDNMTKSNGGNWTVEDNEVAYYWLVLYFATVYQWHN